MKAVAVEKGTMKEVIAQQDGVPQQLASKCSEIYHEVSVWSILHSYIGPKGQKQDIPQTVEVAEMSESSQGSSPGHIFHI